MTQKTNVIFQFSLLISFHFNEALENFYDPISTKNTLFNYSIDQNNLNLSL